MSAIKWPPYRVVCPVPARDGVTYYVDATTTDEATEAKVWADDEEGR